MSNVSRSPTLASVLPFPASKPVHDDDEKPKRAPGSFCVPRAVVQALLKARATVNEINAYLVLANHTDASGVFATASVSAVHRRTGVNKVRGGPLDRAFQRLQTITAPHTVTTPNGGRGVEECPIVIAREVWLAAPGNTVPDGPHEQARVRFILPDFGEPLAERVWFSGNLVLGINTFERPLWTLKHAGNFAARLLLSLHAANDMETWGGVRPVGAGHGPWVSYKCVQDVPVPGGARLLLAREDSVVTPSEDIDLIADGDEGAYWNALMALEAAGLVYQVVTVLNRDPVTRDGDQVEIDAEAEPYYELDARSKHGFKPAGEEGLGSLTARTAGELGHPVTCCGAERENEDKWDKRTGAWIASSAATAGEFNGTYAGLVPAGHGAALVGIFRPRFRVSNRRSAGVKAAWAGRKLRHREALRLIERIRKANNLPPVEDPAAVARKARVAAAAVAPTPDTSTPAAATA